MKDIPPDRRGSIYNSDKIDDVTTKNRVGFTTKTAFGGILCITGGIYLLYYLITSLQIVISNKEHSFSSIKFTFSDNELREQEVSLGKFNASLNFIFGFTNLEEDFDIQNNPYVEYIGYELTNSQPGFHDIDAKYELERCQKEFMN